MNYIDWIEFVGVSLLLLSFFLNLTDKYFANFAKI